MLLAGIAVNSMAHRIICNILLISYVPLDLGILELLHRDVADWDAEGQRAMALVSSKETFTGQQHLYF